MKQSLKGMNVGIGEGKKLQGCKISSPLYNKYLGLDKTFILFVHNSFVYNENCTSPRVPFINKQGRLRT